MEVLEVKVEWSAIRKEQTAGVQEREELMESRDTEEETALLLYDI
jgi:hypothetical protein